MGVNAEGWRIGDAVESLDFVTLILKKKVM